MKNIFQDLKRKDHKRYLGGLDVFKYIGPGLLVTVGFIDPGNWASNFAAGSEFGYSLLWVVTLSTIMLIVLQHNVAHLGIVTGLCLSEAATKYTPKWVSRPILGTAVLASISTSLAEILGGAIALEMLFDIPIIWGAVLTTLFVSIMLFTNSFHHCICLRYRAFVYLRTVSGGNRLAGCNSRVGDSFFSERKYADYHECVGSGSDAS